MNTYTTLASVQVSEAEERVGAVTSKHVFAVGKKSALKVRNDDKCFSVIYLA